MKPLFFQRIRKLIKSNIVAILLATMFFSCDRDPKIVAKLTAKDSIPDVSITNIHVKETENGKMKMELTGPKMIAFQTDNAYTEFPEGIRILFYDSLHNLESELTANYGISWDNKRLMQARGKVVVKNIKKSTCLETESLNWDQNIKKVYTSEFVKITEPDKIIMGTGMESNELFNNWIIRNVSGSIYVNESK